MMLAARQMVRPEPRYAPLLAGRVDLLEQYMSRGPVMCGESYPDECWMFCNAVAVAAVRMSDLLDGRDHSPFIRRWLATVKAKLVHKESGLLVSSFTYDGRPTDGPEGSSIWMVAHCLKVVDPEFAAEQYRLARRATRQGSPGVRLRPGMAADLGGDAGRRFRPDRPGAGRQRRLQRLGDSGGRELSTTTHTCGGF